MNGPAIKDMHQKYYNNLNKDSVLVLFKLSSCHKRIYSIPLGNHSLGFSIQTVAAYCMHINDNRGQATGS